MGWVWRFTCVLPIRHDQKLNFSIVIVYLLGGGRR
uniref:Uncharacterized protein n=1 Tax=Arundo donax TaxID=35708 RepID=A0A0A8YM75_ARUDO